jgi:hypothetical protein
MMSRYLDLLAAVDTALGQIRLDNGYRTEAGLRVWRNLEYQTAPPDKPCVIVYPKGVEDDVDNACIGEENHRLQLEIEGFIDDLETGETGEGLRLDILQALKSDETFGGLAEEGIISSGSNVQTEDAGEEGFLSFVQVRVTLSYFTAWGGE